MESWSLKLWMHDPSAPKIISRTRTYVDGTR